jgi:hypothetical protein
MGEGGGVVKMRAFYVFCKYLITDSKIFVPCDSYFMQNHVSQLKHTATPLSRVGTLLLIEIGA